MNTLAVRPRVAELGFQIYGRPLHPELFDLLAARAFERDGESLRVWVTRAGHVLTWAGPDRTLSEVLDADRPHSAARRLLGHRLRGEHSATLDLGRGTTYRASFQVEAMTPEVFRHVHDEILADGGRRGLLVNFQPNHRLAVAPLGLVVVEMKPRRLFVTAFHTFPEECTVVKSQTLIERG